MTPDFASPPLVLLALACAWGAAACSVWAFLDLLRQARERQLALRTEIVVTETKNPLMRLLLPLARRTGQGARASFERPEDHPAGPGFYRVFHARLRGRLASAGHPEGINADEYVGFVLLATLAGGFAGTGAFLVTGGVSVVTYFAGGAVLGALYLPSWLRRKTLQRHNAIFKELPFALDLLTLAMEAGLDFTSALDRICRKLGRSALGEEMQFMLREIRLGKTRSEAMRDLARRLNVSEVTSVMSSLVQAEEMGSNIGPVLRIQAEQQRERRSQRAEEMAGRAPVKMLFPLVLVLFVTLLWLFAPMVIPLIG